MLLAVLRGRYRLVAHALRRSALAHHLNASGTTIEPNASLVPRGVWAAHNGMVVAWYSAAPTNLLIRPCPCLPPFAARSMHCCRYVSSNCKNSGAASDLGGAAVANLLGGFACGDGSLTRL